MMKVFVAILSLAVFANADDMKCAVDSAKAVDQATDAAIYLWAATKRCGSTDTHKELKCAMDVTATATAVGNMANILVAALDKCDAIKSDKCGTLAGDMVAATAGLASFTAGTVDACPNEYADVAAKDDLEDVGLNRNLNLGKCIVDAKGSLKGIFEVTASLKKVEDGGDAAHNALATVSAFGALGSAIAAAVHDCSAFAGQGVAHAKCAAKSSGLVREITQISNIALSMSHSCSASASRLYIENGKATTATNNSMSLALAAFLPVAAVLGFVLGRRMGKTSAHRDIEALAMTEGELE